MQVLKSLGELLDDVELVFMREHLCFVTWELQNSWPERNKGISAQENDGAAAKMYLPFSRAEQVPSVPALLHI